MILARLLLLTLLLPFAAHAQRDADAIMQELGKLAWQRGPAQGSIGATAKIRIPEGYAFLDEGNTRRFLELMGNPPRDKHFMLAPQNISWFAVFSFDAVGYVKDDEKIEPEALLDSLKKGDERSNEERKRLGMTAIYTDGWHVPPHYDAESKRLEWSMRLRDEQGGTHVNYTSRLLGRTGVMSAVLVSAPATLDRDVADYKSALRGFEFATGERYAEFKPGDRVAEYGLGALVLGGAAAAAAKTGLFKALGKFLWLIAAGGLALVWPLMKRLFARKQSPPPPGPG